MLRAAACCDVPALTPALAESSQNGFTPLNLASENGHVDVAKLLLDAGGSGASLFGSLCC